MWDVFAYGTLMWAPVLEALVGRRFPYTPARLEGWDRFVLRGQPYPGIVATPGAVTDGGVWHGVDAASLDLLDRFEDEGYVRREVAVTLESGDALSAQAWLIPDASRHLLGDERWDEARFREQHGAAYLETCRRFRAGRAETADSGGP